MNTKTQKYPKSESDEIQQIAAKFTELLGVETFIDRRADGRYDVWFAEEVAGSEYLQTNWSAAEVAAAWIAAQFAFCAGRIAQSEQNITLLEARDLNANQARAFGVMEIENRNAPF